MQQIKLSPLNQTYLNNSKEISVPAAAVKKDSYKDDNKKLKLALLGLAVAGSAIAGIAIGKHAKAQQLADIIEFKPAKTLEEAKEFAKKNLHIRKYNLTDLDSANYVNEAFVNFNNNISKDHKRVIKNVLLPPDSEPNSTIFGINGVKTLFVNESFIKDIDKELDNLIERNTVEESVICLGFKDKFLNYKNGNASLKDKFELYQLFENQINVSISRTHAFAKLLNSANVINYLKENKSLPQTISEFMELDNKTQGKILKTVRKNVEGAKLVSTDGDPFRFINHEIGHVYHQENIGSELWLKYNGISYENGKITEIPQKELTKKFKEEIGEALTCDIEANISRYAIKDPCEFVAETFSYLANGAKFSDEIMELYNKYGGMMP